MDTSTTAGSRRQPPSLPTHGGGGARKAPPRGGEAQHEAAVLTCSCGFLFRPAGQPRSSPTSLTV